MEPTERVILNVGGKKFETLAETLYQADYFRNLLSGEKWTCSIRNGEPVFVNRCGGLFKHVHRWLLDHRYSLPEKCLPEFDFYGISVRVLEKKEKSSKLDEGAQILQPLSVLMFQAEFGPRWVRFQNFLFPRKRLTWVKFNSQRYVKFYFDKEFISCQMDGSLFLVEALDDFVRRVAFEGEQVCAADGTQWYFPERMKRPIVYDCDPFSSPSDRGFCYPISDGEVFQRMLQLT